MSEALNLLTRALGGYNTEAAIQRRKLEKAVPGSDEARAAQHNIDTLAGRTADIQAALVMLGALRIAEI